MNTAADTFPDDVKELRAYFRPAVAGQAVRAVPGAGLDVPLWILGSSLFGGSLAAALGLPFAFASHFAPQSLFEALEIYRNEFVASEDLAAPYSMAGVSICVADTDAEAAYLFTSQQQQFINLQRGMPGQLNPPVQNMDEIWTPGEKAGVERALGAAIVGGPETVRARLSQFIASTGVNEVIVTAQIFEHSARLRSYELLAEIADLRSQDESRIKSANTQSA
jgi:luciferase family oxidoreductase group 1